MVRKHYYNFRNLANMLKIRSREKDRAQYFNVNQIFSKQIANSFAKITDGWRFLKVIRSKFKTLSRV